MRLAGFVALLVLATLTLTSCDDEKGEGRATATQSGETPATEAGTPVSTDVPTSAPTEAPTLAALPQPTATLKLNRMNCDEIRGTPYRSEDERTWFLDNCIPPTPTPFAEPGLGPDPVCHPSYVGACLLIGVGDYDCAGGTGNGPNYTGRVTVVGPDVFDLDRDNDGIGCE